MFAIDRRCRRVIILFAALVLLRLLATIAAASGDVVGAVAAPSPAATATFSRCAVTFANRRQLNVTLQCRRNALTAELHTFEPHRRFWMNVSIRSHRLDGGGGDDGGGRDGGRGGGSSSGALLVSADVDFCDFLAGRSGLPIYWTFYRQAMRLAEQRVFERCPIAAGAYYVRNYTLDAGVMGAMPLNVNLRLRAAVRSERGALYGFVLDVAIRRRMADATGTAAGGGRMARKERKRAGLS